VVWEKAEGNPLFVEEIVRSLREHGLVTVRDGSLVWRAGTEIQALAFTTEASRAYMSTFRRDGSSVKQQLDQRDTTFGDYRTRKP